jgi:DHA1 family 2-module integral membrane pump EmrD-like MFS transporter
MFFITVLLAILGLVGTDLFVPSLPQIAATYHVLPHVAQLTITLFLIGFASSQLFYGPLSDYFGRKPPLMIGVTIFVIGSLICIIAHSFEMLCTGRIIQGIGVGAGLSLARVIIRDSYTGTLLAVKTAQVGIFVSLTPPLAPLIGGFLQEYFGIKASFVFMFIYGLILLLLLFFKFPETILHKNKELNLKKVILQYIKFTQHHIFIRYALIAGLAFASIILYASVLPFIIQVQLKLSAAMNGIILLLSALGISCGSLLSSRVVKSISSKQLINAGLLLFVLGGILLLITELLFGTELMSLIPCIFLISMACGLIFPNAIVLCFSEIHVNIGIAGALYGTIQMCISTMINLILNTIPHQGQFMLGCFYFCIGAIGLLIVGCRRIA